MSECTNETIEYAIINDGYKPTEKEIKEIARNSLLLKEVRRINKEIWEKSLEKVRIMMKETKGEKAI